MEGTIGMLINYHMCQLSIADICRKKHSNLEKRAFNFQQTVCEEFSDMSNLMAKGIKYLQY